MFILKLFVRLLLLPLLLVKWLIGGVLFLVLGPILLLVGLLIAVVVGAALFVPLLPLIALAFLVWVLLHLSRDGSRVLGF